MAHLSLNMPADSQVFGKKAREVALVVPVSLPRMDDAQAHAPGMNFLAHGLRHLPFLYRHGDMAGPLANPAGATHSTRPEAFERGTFVHIRPGYDKLVG